MAQKRENWIRWDDVKIQTRYTTYFKSEPNGWVTAFIPAFQLVYSAPTYEEADSRSESMVLSFFEYQYTQASPQKFWLEIHKLGFKATQKHDFVMKELLQKSSKKGKMSNKIDSKELPEYDKEKSKNLEYEHA